MRCDVPWILAGGLTPKNVQKAIKISGAKIVDVSSGIEKSPGAKSPNLINAFVKSINDNQPVPVTLEDGVAALAMAEAATQSQISGKSIQLEEVL